MSNSGHTDIADINKKPVDDRQVDLTGFLVEKLGEETYLFSDGKDSIQVEIDEEDFPKIAINEKTKVQLIGEVDTDAFSDPEMEVERLRIL